jgi:hypothetical protein
MSEKVLSSGPVDHSQSHYLAHPVKLLDDLVCFLFDGCFSRSLALSRLVQGTYDPQLAEGARELEQVFGGFYLDLLSVDILAYVKFLHQVEPNSPNRHSLSPWPCLCMPLVRYTCYSRLALSPVGQDCGSLQESRQ